MQKITKISISKFLSLNHQTKPIIKPLSDEHIRNKTLNPQSTYYWLLQTTLHHRIRNATRFNGSRESPVNGNVTEKEKVCSCTNPHRRNRRSKFSTLLPQLQLLLANSIRCTRPTACGSYLLESSAHYAAHGYGWNK